MHETSRHELAADIPCPSLDAALAAATEAHAARLPAQPSSAGSSSGGGAGAVLALLLDIAELADVTGAAHLSFVLDARQQSGRALLHPALGRYQGVWVVVGVGVGCGCVWRGPEAGSGKAAAHFPIVNTTTPEPHNSTTTTTLPGTALCVTLDGVVLSPDDLATLVGAGRGGSAASPAPGYRLSQGSQGAGQGLAAAFAVSDICQTLAGDSCCFFDPSGRILAQSAAELRRPQPRGRRYAYRDGDSADASLLARFPSQFHAPWSFEPRHPVARGDVAATLLRLPLRTPDSYAPSAGPAGGGGGGPGNSAAAAPASGALKDLTLTEADARRALAAFASMAGRGLLMARAPRRVSVAVWEQGAGDMSRVMSVRAGLARLSSSVGSVEAVVPGEWDEGEGRGLV